jgi:aminopeptidase-like protein
VTTAVARWLSGLSARRFTYRIVFVPETIGALVYLSRNIDTMRRETIAGYVVTCVGDDRAYSLLRSRNGNTLADRVGKVVLRSHVPNHVEYSYLDRGSDERQYCAPGIDLPVASIMRTRYNSYPEYHTSLDDLELVTPSGLQGGYNVLRKCVELIEANRTYRSTTLGEPQLGRRGLYPTLSTRGSGFTMRAMMNVLAFSDGERDLVGIAEHAGIPPEDAVSIAKRLEEAGLLEPIDG